MTKDGRREEVHLVGITSIRVYLEQDLQTRSLGTYASSIQ